MTHDAGQPKQPRSLLRPGGQVDPDALRELAAASDGNSEGTIAGDQERPPEVRFELQRDLQKRLDSYLAGRISFLSRTQLRKLIDDSNVTVNGKTAKASTSLRLGDVVVAKIPPPPPKSIQPEAIPIDVLHEDAHILVLNKQPDIIVHPARSHQSGTLLNALVWHLQHNSKVGGELSEVGSDQARPGVVHRLDRDTTGAIVFAKTDEAHWKLGHQFEHRTCEKRYLAVVEGKVEPARDVIDLPIGPHPSKAKGYREKCVVRHDDQGKHSVTIYRVLERYKNHTLVEVDLKTGRTHQIRVHFSHLGWSLLGDDMYDGASTLERDGTTVVARQVLHAATLSIDHPITGERLTFVAPAPADYRAAVETLRSEGVERMDNPPDWLEQVLGKA